MLFCATWPFYKKRQMGNLPASPHLPAPRHQHPSFNSCPFLQPLANSILPHIRLAFNWWCFVPPQDATGGKQAAASLYTFFQTFCITDIPKIQKIRFIFHYFCFVPKDAAGGKRAKIFSPKYLSLVIISSLLSIDWWNIVLCKYLKYCICIRTRHGIYGQIKLFAWRSSQGRSSRELLKAKG